MENRGRKRTETVYELPACSSFEFRPSTSNSPAQTPMSSAHEARDAEMETSSSTSVSTRSEVDGEKESTNGSCDSDSSLHGYYRHQSTSDHTKFKKVLSSLSEQFEESVQLALITKLCELLSFCCDSSLSSLLRLELRPNSTPKARSRGEDCPSQYIQLSGMSAYRCGTTNTLSSRPGMNIWSVKLTNDPIMGRTGGPTHNGGT